MNHSPSALPLVSKGSPIPCCIEAAPSYRAKACYAIQMLLVPLGLDPDWVSQEEITNGIYYGVNPPDAPSVVSLSFSPAAERYFATRAPYDDREMRWIDTGEGRLPALFSDEDERPDLVASSFFLLSGWQEIISPNRDEHGRFPYEDSIQSRHGLARVPIVDEYRELLAERLGEAGIALRRRNWEGRDWALCPTHDIDYLRKWRPGILYRDFIQPLFTRGHDRRIAAAAVQMIKGDPYRRALRRMPAEVTARGGTATYFFKAGGRDAHDVPYRIDRGLAKRTIKSLQNAGFEIALHPSYLTPDEPSMMAAEKGRLEDAAGGPAISVRQHYLRFDPLATPRIHASLKFQIESTLGFAEHEGFRRGTCHPFLLYDVEADFPLEIWEMPLTIMESTLFNRRDLSVEEAIYATQKVAESCRRHRGAMIVLWHNTLWDEIDCPGWGRHFTDTLDHARRNGALIVSLEKALGSWK